MQQDVEMVSDGASSDSSFSDYMEVSPTPPGNRDAPLAICSPVTANIKSDHGDMRKDTINELQKPSMLAWLTDPAGRAEITLIPSVDKPREEETVGVHYCTLTHVEFIGLMHVKRNDPESHHYRETEALLNELGPVQPLHPAVARRQQRQVDYLLKLEPTGLRSDHVRDANDDCPQNAQGNPQRNGSSDTNTSIPQNEQSVPSNIATIPSQPTQVPQQSQRSPAVYVVLIQYQPMVEYGGSEFEFGMQDQYPKTNGFSTVQHYTKAFRLQAEAKVYALELFTQRITLDYRYMMQKAWEDLSLEEIRAYGVTEDGPSPHIRGFRMSSISEPHYWQVRFGCDEEFCRISVIPVKSSDSRLQNVPFVEAGQPHGWVPTSLEPPKRPAKTPVDAGMTDGADGTTSTEAASGMEQSNSSGSATHTGTAPTETPPPNEG